MRSRHNAFHLAIPTRDLDDAVWFYRKQLGAKLARHYPDRVTFDFFGDQLVCHLSDDVAPEARQYPRHFGITFVDGSEFDNLWRLVELRKVRTLAAPSIRFEGTAEEHRTFLLADPSNNVLEFKHYADPRMLF